MPTTIKSELLLASVNSVTGDILYTFKWVYPRMLLSEVNTHRMLSRNTSSSRAIPSKRQRSRVWNDPFVPTKIGEAQKGMAPGSELRGLRRATASLVWKGARLPALLAASILDRLGVHKGISNRLIEPWVWTEQLVSATDLDNLFLLRANEMAEPHFQELAYQAKEQAAMVARSWFKNGFETFSVRTDGPLGNRVQLLGPGQWHLPFVSHEELRSLHSLYIKSVRVPGHREIAETQALDTAKKVSSARCARVSYNLPDTGKPSSVADDLKLYERLAGADPKHLSPVEHQATPMLRSEYSGNFRGWKQFRKEIEEGTA